ncbi:MAG: amino acid ABC transporter permease, partial [Candidatus Hodarchaeota archaeon]
ISLGIGVETGSTWQPNQKRFIVHIFGMLYIFAPLCLIGLLIIYASLFNEKNKLKDNYFIIQDIKIMIPSTITTNDILKIGSIMAALGISVFNLFLLLEGYRYPARHEIPIFGDWSNLSELLLVAAEIILLGIAIMLIALLFDTAILPGLDRKQRNLRETLPIAWERIRSTGKGTLISIIVLAVALLLLEQGLVMQRFSGRPLQFSFFGVEIFSYRFPERKWIIDPLLDFIDNSFRFIGYFVNPLMSALGLGIEIGPLFSRGNWRTSDPALFRVIFRNLGEGAVATLTVSIASLFFGFILGTFIGTIGVTSEIPIPFVGHRVSGWITAIIQRINTSFVEIWRGTPLMAQVFFIWAGVPAILQTGIPFPLFSWKEGVISIQPLNEPIGLIRDQTFVWDIIVAGIVALTLNTAAYQSEIIRSGIQAIPSGQLEAARSLGMPYSQGMRHVVLPQAFRLIIPPLTNEFINLLLNSSILSVISVFELTRHARNLNNSSFRSFEVFGCLMLCYFAMTFVLSRIFRRLEEKFRIPGLGVS